MSTEVHVAFLWHMHQPEYRDLHSGVAALPWVRLHSSSGYHHMARVLTAHPPARVTVNFVPCLTEQLTAWTAGGPADAWAALATQPAWNDTERAFLRRHCFSTAVARAAARWPEYGRLWAVREQAEAWRDEDYRQVVGLFELSWLDPRRLGDDPVVARLAEQGGPFSPADIVRIHDFQQALAAEVLPAWQALARTGQVALTTTPFYHPILPILAGPTDAHESVPGLPLPTSLPPLPGDARWQLAAAVAQHAATFGQSPAGMWPSEGAIGQAVLPLLPPEIGWLVTDQAQLYRSLGAYDLPDERLYRPWLATCGDRDVALFFRDRGLSDRIGFVYGRLTAAAAVEDFVAYVHGIRQRVPAGPAVVTVALDGENPWGGYSDGGDAFLRTLYGRLTTEPGIRMTTFGDYLAAYPPTDRLERLATGSWIHGDLTTWIGDAAHNQAWDRLAAARIDLEQALPDPDGQSTAWRSLWAAEGSDWFWWYSHRHSSHEDRVFDRIFRRHLANTYLARDATPPAILDEPIIGHPGADGAMAPGA